MYIFTWALEGKDPGPTELALGKLRVQEAEPGAPSLGPHSAVKRQLSKALGDVYNLQRPLQGPLHPIRAGYEGSPVEPAV